MKMNTTILSSILQFSVILVSSLLANATTTATTAATAAAVHQVPTFSLDEIQLGHRLAELSEILRTTGLFSVKPATQSPSRRAAMNGLCQCLPKQANHRNLQSVDSIWLQDGHTKRTTIATATIGKDPLPFEDQLQQLCGQDTLEHMETLRDEVAVVSNSVVKSLDRVLGYGSTHDRMNEGPLLESESGMMYRTLASIVHSANHLEHFHHYSSSSSSKASATTTFADQQQQPKTVDWHTDAGLFLTFLPAHDCIDGQQQQQQQDDESFWVQLPNGETSMASFEPGSVAVMMGAGAEHWLQSSSSVSLRATRHAVQMNPNSSRVWYGMMHLVPEDSIIQESPRRTFGDMKQNMKVTDERGSSEALGNQQVAIGCGPSTDAPLSQAAAAVVHRRRRLQHVQSASACNNITNFFCWTQCLEVPNYQQAESYIVEGNSLYCLDPGILARSGNSVPKAVEPCIGKVHNSNCQGIWHPTSPSVPGWPVEFNATFNSDDEQYCYGGTSMYMDGFHWIHDTTCVIYLFPSLVLSSQGKFIGACLGTILFGMMVEAIIFRRRKSIVNFRPGMSRLLASAAFYALQLTMGYFVMLIVMTYSMPLFLCCIGGLVLGHVVFNARDALLNRQPKSSELDEEEDDEEEEDMDGAIDSTNPEEDKLTPCGKVAKKGVEGFPEEIIDCGCVGSQAPKKKKKVEDRSQGIPEGSTPCCQNSLDVC